MGLVLNQKYTFEHLACLVTDSSGRIKALWLQAISEVKIRMIKNNNVLHYVLTKLDQTHH